MNKKKRKGKKKEKKMNKQKRKGKKKKKKMNKKKRKGKKKKMNKKKRKGKKKEKEKVEENFESLKDKSLNLIEGTITTGCPTKIVLFSPHRFEFDRGISNNGGLIVPKSKKEDRIGETQSF
ncbi:hypothetical protein M8J77_023236 [Diaphorina citri]|nr:hypothetical protein M8J77_023236 [Diaphorina citri]